MLVEGLHTAVTGAQAAHGNKRPKQTRSTCEQWETFYSHPQNALPPQLSPRNGLHPQAHTEDMALDTGNQQRLQGRSWRPHG